MGAENKIIECCISYLRNSHPKYNICAINVITTITSCIENVYAENNQTLSLMVELFRSRNEIDESVLAVFIENFIEFVLKIPEPAPCIAELLNQEIESVKNTRNLQCLFYMLKSIGKSES